MGSPANVSSCGRTIVMPSTRSKEAELAGKFAKEAKAEGNTESGWRANLLRGKGKALKEEASRNGQPS